MILTVNHETHQFHTVRAGSYLEFRLLTKFERDGKTSTVFRVKGVAYSAFKSPYDATAFRNKLVLEGKQDADLQAT